MSESTGTDARSTAPAGSPPAGQPHDEHLWLEEIDGPAPLAWVARQNARTLSLLEGPALERLEADVLAVMDSADRIPMVAKHGEHYYNFWRDAEHPRGLFRRTGWESWTGEDPQWEVLLDVDALAAAEGVDWVWGGARLLRPQYTGGVHRRALVSLSPDGGDAKRVREFDLERREFVPGGFDVPTAKSSVTWVDADTVHVGTDFGPGSLTTSSYPRTVRVLRRGQDLAEARQVFEVPEDHVQAVLVRDHTPGFVRDVAVDVVDFFSSRTHLVRDGGLVHVDVPETVTVDLHRQWLLLRPQEDFELGGTRHLAGSLLAADLEAFLAGDRTVVPVFVPDAHTSLQSWSWTADRLLLELLRDVSSVVLVAEPGTWTTAELPGAPALHSVDAWAVDDEDPEAGNDHWLVATGFLTPTTVARGTLATGTDPGTAPRVVKRAPSFFDASGLVVEQHFAVSADGTRVPYFQVGPAGLVADGRNPTLLSGYGGFEVSRTPSYSGSLGRSWLARTDDEGRSGVYVLANIRGGGEYGPSWHRAALRERRHRAYEDFAAVAADLQARGVCSRERLACSGGSNGGLLVGNMLTRWPHLFGAVSCGVPLLDMRRYTQLSAGASWIAEYGDPEDPAQWEFLRTFSPYHLMRAGEDYPPVLFWTATSDDRVGPVQARKAAARLQGLGHEDVWFYEATNGGHAGAGDNKQAARLHALSHEFLWRMLHRD
ncbi:prolyl oligopeptidase [Kocuria flava]|uniref:Peptidase n=1 Tax=Kocuria flava TaxID=446860 RepID=A0A0U3HF29_9MICC|nr:prolyl oligopeptidase family serine peptidase [Kocuria flava]ALU39416.1 prolyl oligopeptidase [Kocuria flava]GEO92465.1 putative peptidase [Kocuria flava]